jgi:hypothetical protein
MHLIALKLRKTIDIPWLADFRDPWTNIDFYKDLLLTSWADRKHHKLEKGILQKADAISVISNTMAEDMQKLYNRQYEVITNGYDIEANISNVVIDKKFSIVHIGSLVKTRNPEILWTVLKHLITNESLQHFENKKFTNDLEIKLVGKVDYSVKESIKKYDLEKYVTYIDYLPHDEVAKVQQQSQVLLLLLNNTHNAKMILTGKFFEYMVAKRPILCIGPIDGDASKILNSTNSGLISDFDDYETLKNNVIKYYEAYCSGSLIINSSGTDKFTRKNLTFKLSEVLNEMVRTYNQNPAQTLN